MRVHAFVSIYFKYPFFCPPEREAEIHNEKEQ